MKQIVIYDVVCNACVQSVRTNINIGTVIKNQKYKNGFKIKIEKTTGGCVQAHVIL